MKTENKLKQFFINHQLGAIISILSLISVISFIYFYQNGLGLAYNDARSHLDIGRRVVEGLTPGIAQIGSVWLPITHLVMSVTIWNDFMWHSGLSGAIQSMIAYVAVGILIFQFLKELKVGILGRLVGVVIFAFNPNVLYLQSTAMTEVVFMGTMMAAFYYSLLWYKKREVNFLIFSAFWIMVSSLIRYDGWFLFLLAVIALILSGRKLKNWRTLEGRLILFCSLGGLGVVLWFLWNLVIFGDPFYFAFGSSSAHAQQDILEKAGTLLSKGNWLFSIKIYVYSWIYNLGFFNFILSVLGFVAFFFSKKVQPNLKYLSFLLLAPLLFNILALYLGHSVVNIVGISGDAWFNVRYGALMIPTSAIFIGLLFSRLNKKYFLQLAMIVLLLISNGFIILKSEAVSIQDARFGESQKNVNEVSDWLRENAKNKEGQILMSVASHDAIIFTSGLPMLRFIHEGNGEFYNSAMKNPDEHVKWIIVNRDSGTDLVWDGIQDNPKFKKFELVQQYPFADVYQLRKRNY